MTWEASRPTGKSVEDSPGIPYHFVPEIARGQRFSNTRTSMSSTTVSQPFLGGGLSLNRTVLRYHRLSGYRPVGVFNGALLGTHLGNIRGCMGIMENKMGTTKV